MSSGRGASDGSGEAPAIDVSVLVVTWNSAGWIRRCLESIPAACEGISSEVIVHDNGSTDGTAAEAADVSGVNPNVIRAGENFGFAGGVNRALDRSRGRMILLLNPDCVARPGSITRLVGHLDETPESAGAAPLLIDDGGVPQREFQLRRLPTLRSIASGLLLLDRLAPGNPIGASHHYRDLAIEQPRRIEQPAGAAILLRREVLDRIGPFDERFAPAWFEDVDYCRRLRNADLWVDLVPDAVIAHRGGTSLEHLPFPDFLRIFYRNLYRYGVKWMTPGQAEVLRWTIMGGMLLRAAAVAVGLSSIPVSRAEGVRAHLSVLKSAFERWEESASS